MSSFETDDLGSKEVFVDELGEQELIMDEIEIEERPRYQSANSSSDTNNSSDKSLAVAGILFLAIYVLLLGAGIIVAISLKGDF